MNEEKTTVKISKHMHKKLLKYCKENGLLMYGVVDNAIQHFIEK